MTRLEPAAIAAHMASLPAWTLAPDGRSIAREFRFAGFGPAFAFMTEVALAAERHDHHPDWSNVYNRVTVRWSTHDAGGLTGRDFALAGACDAAFARHGQG